MSESLSGASRFAAGARPATPARGQSWPERLAEMLASTRHTPFAWGLHDCATIACDWVLEMRGVDPMAAERGTYGTEAEYEAMTAAEGGLQAFVAARAERAGIAACPPAFAQRGDIALVRLGNQECLGIVAGRHVAVPTLGGLRLAPASAIACAWAV